MTDSTNHRAALPPRRKAITTQTPSFTEQETVDDSADAVASAPIKKAKPAKE